MLIHGRPALLPFPGFLFERAAIFTSAAENIGNLWNEACKHGLKADRHTHTHTHTHTHITKSKAIAHERHGNIRHESRVTWRHLHYHGRHFRFRFYLLPSCLL